MFIKVWLETIKADSRFETLIEVDDEEWAALNEVDRDKRVGRSFWVAVIKDWGWEESRKGTNVRSYE